jgi:hypothetical protein
VVFHNPKKTIFGKEVGFLDWIGFIDRAKVGFENLRE